MQYYTKRKNFFLALFTVFLTVAAVIAVVSLFYNALTMKKNPALKVTGPAEQKPEEEQRGRKVAVLLFHAVDPNGVNPGAMQPEALEATFQAMKDCGYRPITLQQFHAFIEGCSAVPEKAVLLTFDDGYRDIFEYVLPLTMRYKYPAVLFAISKWFDPYPRPEPSRPHLSAREASALLKTGLWSLGGHGYEGHRLVMGGNYATGPFYVTRAWNGTHNRVENAAEYRARVWADLSLERAALERAGISGVRDFAYPYGAYNEELIELLQEAGYRYMYTNSPGLVGPGQDRSCIPRITAGRNSYETMALLGWYFSKEK